MENIQGKHTVLVLVQCTRLSMMRETDQEMCSLGAKNAYRSTLKSRFDCDARRQRKAVTRDEALRNKWTTHKQPSASKVMLAVLWKTNGDTLCHYLKC